MTLFGRLNHRLYLTREGQKLLYLAEQVLLEQALAERNLRLKRHWICNSPESVKQAVEKRCGIALISRFLVQEELREGRLVQISVREKLFGRQFVLAYHKDKLQDECFRGFTEFCREKGMDGMRELLLIKK